MQDLSKRQIQIIDYSIKIISERGIQELTMKNLSGELGISEPAIYRHFDNKQEILMAVLESFKHRNRLINDGNSNEEMTAFQHLQWVISGIFMKFAGNPAIAAVIFSEEIFHSESELAEMILGMMSSNKEFFQELIEKGQTDGSIRSDIRADELNIMVVGSVRYLVTVWRLSGLSFDLNESGDKLLKSWEVMMGR